MALFFTLLCHIYLHCILPVLLPLPPRTRASCDARRLRCLATYHAYPMQSPISTVFLWDTLPTALLSKCHVGLSQVQWHTQVPSICQSCLRPLLTTLQVLLHYSSLWPALGSAPAPHHGDARPQLTWLLAHPAPMILPAGNLSCFPGFHPLLKLTMKVGTAPSFHQPPSTHSGMKVDSSRPVVWVLPLHSPPQCKNDQC